MEKKKVLKVTTSYRRIKDECFARRVLAEAMKDSLPRAEYTTIRSCNAQLDYLTQMLLCVMNRYGIREMRSVDGTFFYDAIDRAPEDAGNNPAVKEASNA